MINTKILIVEDESIVALDIKQALKSFGYKDIYCTTNYDETLAHVKEFRPSLIFMDINLKNSKDGIETAIAVQTIENIPIIYLTAYSDEDTISRAIHTNPIGYILKPFKREELKSIIMLCLYKIDKAKKEYINKNNICLGDNYYYALEDEILFYNEIPIKLGVKEKKLLTLLVEAKGRIVSFNEIEYLLWPDSPVSDSTLRTLIYRLRCKLEYKIIETITSIGCKIIPL
ncbi:MAG: response regulator [Arcobacter sp.]|uniref:response regulator n=1 Tax=Arcobacter sp. TaxID=1872629 RepID=UPI003AFF6772